MTDHPAPMLYRSRDASSFERLRDRRDVVRVRHGVYADATEWHNLSPWSRYEQRVRAHLIACPDAVMSHESAAALLGLPVFGEPRDIHVFAGERTSTKRVGDTVHHTSADAREIIAVEGGRATSPSSTAIDLGRVLSPAAGLAVWDAVLRRGINLSDLTGEWHDQASSRGTRTLSWLSAHADPLAESAGESVSRATLLWLGFPPPQLQHSFAIGDSTYRADFWWPDLGVWGEFDGQDKYSMSPGTERDALIAEKHREDSIRRHVGGFARWSFADLTDPRRLRDILHLAGLREVAPPDALRLSTLPRLFRNRRTL